jgi:hypothetical protein
VHSAKDAVQSVSNGATELESKATHCAQERAQKAGDEPKDAQSPK